MPALFHRLATGCQHWFLQRFSTQGSMCSCEGTAGKLLLSARCTVGHQADFDALSTRS